MFKLAYSSYQAGCSVLYILEFPDLNVLEGRRVAHCKSQSWNIQMHALTF